MELKGEREKVLRLLRVVSGKLSARRVRTHLKKDEKTYHTVDSIIILCYLKYGNLFLEKLLITTIILIHFDKRFCDSCACVLLRRGLRYE